MGTVKRYTRKSTGITISIFYEQYQLTKYNFEAPYQRDYNVWDDNQKSFLIDTIMKNFPMPPIFLEQKIDDSTGRTRYDVIDGKQRLTALVDFIENKIKLPETFGKDDYGNELLNGKSFDEIRIIAKTDEAIRDYVSDFWSYVISIEYIENPDNKIVDSIFDRLNRGGERLNPQELRKAKYYDSIMYQDIANLRKDDFISDLLCNLNKSRLEDVSFITELYLLIKLNRIIDGTEFQIDSFFEQLVDDTDEDESKLIISTINQIKEIVKYFSLDYDEYKIKGVSHLYAIWYFAYYIHQNKIILEESLVKRLDDFYRDLRQERKDPKTIEYHKSMQSASKSKHSRKKRVTSLLGYFDYTFDESQL